MLVVDKDGIFTSLDYGDSWNFKEVIGRKVSMSQDGSHMYLCSEDFQYSIDYSHTWITNSPKQGISYSGVDCDKTGRYVYLIGDFSHAWFWLRNNYGKTFTMITIPEMYIATDIHVSSDGNKIMIYDGDKHIWFKTITSHTTSNTGNLIVNRTINSISGTFDYLKGNFGHFSTLEVDDFSLQSEQILTDLKVTHSLTGSSAFISNISNSHFTGNSEYFDDLYTSKIMGSSCFFDRVFRIWYFMVILFHHIISLVRLVSF